MRKNKINKENYRDDNNTEIKNTSEIANFNNSNTLDKFQKNETEENQNKIDYGKFNIFKYL